MKLSTFVRPKDTQKAENKEKCIFPQKNNQKLLHNKKQCVYLHRG